MSDTKSNRSYITKISQPVVSLNG